MASMLCWSARVLCACVQVLKFSSVSRWLQHSSLIFFGVVQWSRCNAVWSDAKAQVWLAASVYSGLSRLCHLLIFGESFCVGVSGSLCGPFPVLLLGAAPCSAFAWCRKVIWTLGTGERIGLTQASASNQEERLIRSVVLGRSWTATLGTWALCICWLFKWNQFAALAVWL